jgi:hypothetical protein
MIELYIDNKLVQFAQPPQINIVLQHEDTHNPTIVKNNFSHTIQVNGTKENNKLFNCFYDNTRINGEGVFNANKKVPFVLYNNGDIVEQGYCKLTEVKRKGNDIEYSIQLFGGLGQFLYSLSYKEDGEEMKLSDLSYTDDDDRKLNFVVNRNAIYDAWSSNIWDDNSRYSVINFAPCYNGIPSDFDANKVVINVNNLPDSIELNTTNEKDGRIYTDINGYVLAELPNELDDTQVKDYRSYLQRPIIRMKSILNACFNPINNNGWEVDLDEDFFNDENPYYNDVWMTLPLLREVETETSLNIEKIDDKYYINNYEDNELFNLEIPITPLVATKEKDITNIKTGRTIIRTGVERAQNTALCFQLVVYDANDNIIDVSQAISIYTLVQNANTFDYSNLIYGNYPSGFPQVVNGEFKFKEYDTYTDYNIFQFTTDIILKTIKIKYQQGMYFKIMPTITSVVYDNGNITYSNESKMVGYSSYYKQYITLQDINYNVFKVNLEDSYSLKKGYNFSKNKHLKSENTPCKYMLDYLKMFNLHIWHDTYENKIHIRKRENYFTHNIKDIDNIIDRGKEMTITPLTFENKWLSFGSEYNTENVLAKEYIDNYGYSYGVQRVNTNYNFDSSTKELFSDSIYKGAIMNQRENKYYAISNNDTPSFFVNGLTTYLFNEEGESIEGDRFNPVSFYFYWGENNPDIIPRCSFVNDNNEGINGANVLLFFNGFSEIVDYNYKITDDIKEFDRLNDSTPCWIYTNDNYNVNGVEIAKTIEQIPLFNRYNIEHVNNTITHSLDFGTPQVLYINYHINNESDLYSQYWKPYITDKLSVDNRLVSCYVLFNRQLKNEDLRDFYYFDNAYWVLSEVETSVGQNNIPSKATFYKVIDLNNYK